MLTVLNKHQLAYLVVGGLAAEIHGAQIPRSNDIDMVIGRDSESLGRVCSALAELKATIRVPGAATENLPTVDITPPFFATLGTAMFSTVFGPLDVGFRPDGTEGYGDLVRAAELVSFLGVPTWVASLADIIRSKRAAGRTKDLSVLPLLEERLQSFGSRLGPGPGAHSGD